MKKTKQPERSSINIVCTLNAKSGGLNATVTASPKLETDIAALGISAAIYRTLSQFIKEIEPPIKSEVCLIINSMNFSISAELEEKPNQPAEEKIRETAA